MANKNKIYAILGFSGSGKDTTVKNLTKELDNIVSLTSHTTRPMRDGEVNGREYYFIDDNEFNSLYEAGMFVEVRDYEISDGTHWYYGFQTTEVDEKMKQGNVIFIVDLDGYKSFKEIYGEKVVGIFLKVDLDILINRILNRERLSWFVVEEAVRRLKSDIERFEEVENIVDYVIETDNTQYTIQEIKKIISKE